ncbi:MAG: membrane dipeptidase [Acidobacteria bacterium]|nr:MAG: membrane dipeptidase [Acidobacteriota bacterium]
MCTSHARAGGVAALLMLPAIASMQTADVAVSARARQLHDRAIVIDTHDDTTQRLLDDKSFDIGARNADGSIDIPRMREGGLDALFFSIWMPGDVTGPAAIKQALQQIDSVREAVRLHPRDLVLATSVADIRRAAADRKIAALMGLEGGHMIDEDLGVLRMYAALGVRYMTLTHSLNTTWADSSGDTPAHNGLTAFGKDVVRELNRLGVMVDISHVADKTFFDALEVTRAPVIASHSSARAIANAPRNMTDDMLRALAKNGGVVMINYNAGFISEPFRVAPRPAEFTARVDAIHKRCGTDEACSILDEQRANWDAMRAGVLPMVTWETIVAHIDHAVKIAGVDHVGLGSDFDGAVMPLGMEDASKLPRITDALLKKGYSERDVEKILGGNLLRVMEQVERAAREGSSR